MNHKIMRLARESEDALMEYNGSKEDYVQNIDIVILYGYKKVFMKWTSVFSEYDDTTDYDDDEDISLINYGLVDNASNDFVYDILKDGYKFYKSLLRCVLHAINFDLLKIMHKTDRIDIEIIGDYIEDLMNNEDDEETEEQCLKILKFIFTVVLEKNHSYQYYYMRMVLRDNVKHFKFFIDIGIDINYDYGNGKTLLAGAFEGGNIDRVKLLIEYGADPFLKNKFGESPYDILIKQHKEHPNYAKDIYEYVTKIAEEKDRSKRVKIS